MRQFLVRTDIPFIMRLSPVLSAITLFWAMFGMTMAIRLVIEQKFYLTRWWAFRVGDSIGFPIFAYYASLALSDFDDYEAKYWHDQRWFKIALCLFWWGVNIGTQLDAAKNRGVTMQDVLTPSELYHSLMMGPVGALIVSTLLAVWRSKAPITIKLAATSGLGIWVGCAAYDSVYVDRTAPGR